MRELVFYEPGDGWFCRPGWFEGEPLHLVGMGNTPVRSSPSRTQERAIRHALGLVRVHGVTFAPLDERGNPGLQVGWAVEWPVGGEK